MKNLKWLFLLGVIVSFTSCETENLSPEITDDESALLDLMFFATAEDSTNAFRGHHGKCNLSIVPVDELPNSITDYISANYAGASIERAGLNEEKGVYMVGILKEDGTKAGIIFATDGNFIEEKTRQHKGTPIAIDDLPSSISDYVTSNYAGASIDKAFQNAEGKYGVMLTLSDDTHAALGFDAEGTFLGELKMKKRRGKKH